jgi:sigma-B regulation protein RsbU (phosphoserine phosphatase)
MPDAKFSICFEPLNEAGGDFYDVLKITDTTHSYFVADASGHDIGTSFVTASVKALLQQNCAPIYTPTESMKMINRVLLGVLPEGKYLTAAYMTLNRKTSKCTILNMGHPPVLYLPVKGEILYISSQSDVLGAFQEVLYSDYELNVHTGDRFYLYSDGLLEDGSAEKIWTNQKNMEFFSSFLPSLKNISLDDSVKSIKEYFYKDDRPPVDDILIMGVEV